MATSYSGGVLGVMLQMLKDVFMWHIARIPEIYPLTSEYNPNY
jgi:hypothetical protein